MLDISKLRAGVDSTRMMQTLESLTRWVKLSGSPEERQGMAKTAGIFEQLGYDTRIIEHDAFISLPVSATLDCDGKPQRCITHSMSISVENLSGELVYAGTGSREEFEKLDVRGKIVLIDGIAFEDTTLYACQAGAVGQIQISPNERLYEMCVSPVWGSPDLNNRKFLPTSAIVTIPTSAGKKLRERCLAGNPPAVSMSTTVDTDWRKTPILIAELGCENDAPFVMLSGHQDTWHYGVMDNGSANVTMIEAARLLAEHRKEWARGFRVCMWSGHSHGRYSGSSWYADSHRDELEARCVAHINVDSTGGDLATQLTNSGTTAQLAAIVAEAVKRETGQIHKGRRQGRSADQSFWGIGIASAFGSVSHVADPGTMPVALGPYWHTPDDLIEHVNPDYLARDTRIVLEVLARLIGTKDAPIDHRRWCADLKAELDGLREKVEPAVDLSRLYATLEQLDAALATTSDTDTARRIGHHLIPLDHTFGDRFIHDPAMPRPAWPMLEPLRALAASTEPDEIRFASVSARQSINRFLHGLRLAKREIA